MESWINTKHPDTQQLQELVICIQYFCSIGFFETSEHVSKDVRNLNRKKKKVVSIKEASSK